MNKGPEGGRLEKIDPSIPDEIKEYLVDLVALCVLDEI